jgi:protoporphyrinogen oxidase
MSRKTAIIIGAGPAGLTAALELLRRTDIHPIVLEASEVLGGISQTITYKGNRMDIGGHRFFSKSDRVMSWWQEILPLQRTDEAKRTVAITYHRQQRQVVQPGAGPDPEVTERVMLIRRRLSRIYFLRKFFDYPVTLNLTTIRNLGLARMTRIGVSYIRAQLQPIRPERSLEDFMINRFGRELYHTFFQYYTEKVWGAPCREIDPSWGAQRIKGLSVTKVLTNAIMRPFRRRSTSQKDVETSLIEQFLYPKLGPGQMWEEVAAHIRQGGGEVRCGHRVTAVAHSGTRVTGVTVVDEETGEQSELAADYVFSTMPVKELIAGMGPDVPGDVRAIAAGLRYRDFITVGVLLTRLALPGGQGPTNLVPDTWIYIQERDVQIGRLQIFNNWSPYLVADPERTVWLGLEYFCNEGDDLWQMSDDAFLAFAVDELARIDIIDPADVLDGTVRRVRKAYPAYFGTYDQFERIRQYTDTFPNLYLLGRNGMHRYNNADHSMLTAMTAVDNIVSGREDKANIWAVNTETEYHEEA